MGSPQAVYGYCRARQASWRGHKRSGRVAETADSAGWPKEGLVIPDTGGCSDRGSGCSSLGPCSPLVHLRSRGKKKGFGVEGHWFFSKKPLLLHFWFNILIIFYSLAGRNGVFLNRMRALLQDTLSHSPQFTSFIVLVVGARGLHRNTAARSPPACLAFAVPTLLPHGALAVSVAQVWTAVCKERTGWRGRGMSGRGAGCFIIGGTQIKSHVLAHTRTHGHVHMVMTDPWISISLITTWLHAVGIDRWRIRCCAHFPICVPFTMMGWLLIGAHIWIKVRKKNLRHEPHLIIIISASLLLITSNSVYIMGFWWPGSIAFSWENEIMFDGVNVCACICMCVWVCVCVPMN